MEEDWKAKALFYRKIVLKYSEAVNLGEQKTIVDLKAWLRQCAKDPAVAGSSCSSWQECVSFICSIPHLHAGSPVVFWLSPSEVMEIGAGDGFDKSVFLHCLLKAKGINARVRVLELEGTLKHVIVYFALEKGFVLIDPDSCVVREGKSLEDILAQGFEGKKFVKSLYDFDQDEYEEF